jgi:flagellar basal body-associated protein FliL
VITQLQLIIIIIIIVVVVVVVVVGVAYVLFSPDMSFFLTEKFAPGWVF